MSWLRSDVPLVVEVDGLIVRPYDVSDASALVDAVTVSLPELRAWMPWAKFEPQTVAQREELITQWSSEWGAKTNFTMGIFRSDVCVGGTGLHLRGEVGELEIGYWVATPYTRQEIATRVSAALVDVAFGLQEVQHVHISHDIANVASQGVPQRLGFTVLREYEREPLAPKESGHVRVWCLTRDEWSKR